MCYKNLRVRMFERGVCQDEVSGFIGKSLSSVTARFTGRLPWSIDEVYKMCDLLEIPYNEIYDYFPKGGKTETDSESGKSSKRSFARIGA